MNEWLVKRKYLEETCSDAALSTTDPAWLDQGRRSWELVTNLPSYGMTFTKYIS
jgi:hypothetical protein